MSDVNGEEPQRVMQGSRIVGFGTSPDGLTIQMHLSTLDGGKLIITMPAENVPEFHREVGNLLARISPDARGARPASPMPGSWKVGRMDNGDPKLKNITAVCFDEGTTAEKLYLIGDLDALCIADAIETTVFKGLSMEEQRELIQRAQSRGKPSLILPPGKAN